MYSEREVIKENVMDFLGGQPPLFLVPQWARMTALAKVVDCFFFFRYNDGILIQFHFVPGFRRAVILNCYAVFRSITIC